MSALKLHFFTFYDNDFINIRLQENETVIAGNGQEIDALQIWQSVMAILQQEYSSPELIFNAPYEQRELNKQNQPSIIFLLLKMRSLSAPEVLNNLVGSKLRPIAEKIKDTEIEKVYYQPIITISLEDTNDLHTETAEKKQIENKKFDDLKLDPRIHFWDSSIWHRYVPLYPKEEETFKSRFSEVLKEIEKHHEQKLYLTNAARATLEFQLRILRNSYISKFGESGHYEVVTPFKFHSETQMKRRAKEVFPKDIDVKQLRWNALLVDDYSRTPISPLKDENDITKEKLIKQILEDYINIEVISPFKEGENDRIAVIDHSIQKLSESVYDLILLDYLLGDSTQDDSRREYGHELLQRLRWKEDDLSVKRGPLGRHWVVPISSFPFASIDKLQQLGISYSDDEFRISIGGDPICTPHFFRYNLLNLCKEQIDECVLYPSRLEKLIEHLNQIIPKEKEMSLWAKSFETIIEYIDAKRDSLKEVDAKGEKDSKFGKSMIQLNKITKCSDYTSVLGKLKAVLRHLSNWKDKGNYGKDSKSLWDNLLKLKEEDPYQPIFINLKDQIFEIADKNHRSAIKKIEATLKEQNPSLNLARMNIFEIPSKVHKLKDYVQELKLNHNRLSQLPENLQLSTFKNLRRLYLQNNFFETIPKVVFQLKDQLEVLNFNNNEGDYGGSNMNLSGSAIKEFLEKEAAKYDYIFDEKQNESQENRKINIFISYSHKDKEEYRKSIKKRLTQLSKTYNLKIWDDKALTAGDKWNDEIQRRVTNAHIFILLLTIDAQLSDYINYEELQPALQREKEGKCVIVPIICEHTDWENDNIASFQVLPKSTQPIESYESKSKVYLEIQKGLREVIIKILKR